MRQLLHAHPDRGCDEEAVVRAVCEEAAAFRPDVVIVGNLHGAQWPLSLLPALRNSGALVVAFMHDCYFATGRCAYPGACALYETGCDESCPTAAEYPALAPEKIPGAWAERRRIFGGSSGVPMAANSAWTLGLARRSIGEMRSSEVVHYGLDARLFRPIARSLARRLLEIPLDEFVILGGAVNVSERRKGGHIFKEMMEALKGKARFLVFGAEHENLPGVYATGFQRDYRKMPIVYSAADLFVGASLEEAFGQTLCEAAACAIPVVAFKVGGIPEAARHDRNAVLVPEIGAAPLLAAVRGMMDDAEKRERFGIAGRALVEEEFTLERQSERWMRFLNKLAEAG
jgi:glycosyltransferase involved in cell wall biosynthesis